VKRRLFTILSALSLLLLVAVCVMWVRSYVRVDSFEKTPTWGGSSYQVASARGGLWLSASITSGSPVLVHDHVHYKPSTLTGGSLEGVLTNGGYTFATYYYVPYLWLAVLLLFFSQASG
jgi:hypothetical protein